MLWRGSVQGASRRSCFRCSDTPSWGVSTEARPAPNGGPHSKGGKGPSVIPVITGQTGADRDSLRRRGGLRCRSRARPARISAARGGGKDGGEELVHFQVFAYQGVVSSLCCLRSCVQWMLRPNLVQLGRSNGWMTVSSDEVQRIRPSPPPCSKLASASTAVQRPLWRQAGRQFGLLDLRRRPPRPRGPGGGAARRASARVAGTRAVASRAASIALATTWRGSLS